MKLKRRPPIDLSGLDTDRCAVCHCPTERGCPPHSAHHIVKRSHHRCDEPWNLIWLCHRCHGCAEGLTLVDDYGVRWHPISMGSIIAAKLESDPFGSSVAILQTIYRKRLPDSEPIPDVLLAQRRKWG